MDKYTCTHTNAPARMHTYTYEHTNIHIWEHKNTHTDTYIQTYVVYVDTGELLQGLVDHSNLLILLPLLLTHLSAFLVAVTCVALLQATLQLLEIVAIGGCRVDAATAAAAQRLFSSGVVHRVAASKRMLGEARRGEKGGGM